jgi:hypothetical protein
VLVLPIVIGDLSMMLMVVLADYCRSHFEGWTEEAKGEGLMRDWSGIMCASRDTLPLVGKVPGKEGLWIAVGFHGKCAISLGSTS